MPHHAGSILRLEVLVQLLQAQQYPHVSRHCTTASRYRQAKHGKKDFHLFCTHKNGAD